MTGKLVDRIPQGETVVYRTSSRRVPAWLPFAFLGLAAVWGLFLFATEMLSDQVFWLLYALVLAALVLVAQIWLGTATALVTEARLLYDRGPAASLWGQQRILDLPHAEIAEIRAWRSWLGEAFEMRLADGRVVSLGWIANLSDLVDAVSAVSSVAVSGKR